MIQMKKMIFSVCVFILLFGALVEYEVFGAEHFSVSTAREIEDIADRLLGIGAPLSGPVVIELLNDIDWSADSHAIFPITIIGSTMDITLTGDFTIFANNNSPVVNVSGGGRFTLDGPTLTRRQGQGGRGVVVTGNGSTFVMRNGTISGHVANNSNTPAGIAQNGGGVAVVNGATFIMENGIIENNAAVRGGGVLVSGTGSSFTMYNGIIGDNISTGGVTIQEGAGVAIAVDGTFTMEGGTIYRNTAAVGGGVFVAGALSSFVMIDGAISNNTSTGTGATQGGGGVAAVGNGPFTMIGGIIDNNTAVRGGAVFVTGNTSSFTMEGGVISSNTAYESGGGVFANLPELSRVRINAAARFTDNLVISGRAYYRNPAQDVLYNNNIHSNHWTVPFTQGFNNFDISHTSAEPIRHRVSFYADGGEFFSGVDLLYVDIYHRDFVMSSDIPTSPVRENLDFAGFFDTWGNTFDFSGRIEDEVNLFAFWEAQITFYPNFTDNDSVRSGTVITMPPPLNRVGYTFDGWRHLDEIFLPRQSVSVTRHMNFVGEWSLVSTVIPPNIPPDRPDEPSMPDVPEQPNIPDDENGSEVSNESNRPIDNAPPSSSETIQTVALKDQLSLRHGEVRRQYSRRIDSHRYGLPNLLKLGLYTDENYYGRIRRNS